MMWAQIIDRQQGCLNFTPDLLEAIGRTRILVVGTGGNGTVTDCLLRVGYQHFALVDFDVVEATNLNRLPFTTSEIGVPKVEAWKAYLSRINPACSVTIHRKRLGHADAGWLQERVGDADIVELGTTDREANLPVVQAAIEQGKPLIVGPGTSGCWVVSTVNAGSVRTITRHLASAGRAAKVDNETLKKLYAKLYAFPGRPEKVVADVRRRIERGELPPRSCKIFVSMVNAAMCWETVKNTAALHGITFMDTAVVQFPVIQVFDPYRGGAYYCDLLRDRIGIPNWLTRETRWYVLEEGGMGARRELGAEVACSGA
jgi:hypothetical protein